MPHKDNQTRVVRFGSPFTFLFAVATVTTSLLSVTMASADTNIVWSDEFNGTALDTSKWTYDTGNGFWVPDPGYWVGGW